MKEMLAILHVKNILCNLLHAFSGFELLIFLLEYGAMSSVARKLSSELSTKSNTRRQQKMARGLKFRIKRVNGYYYLCSEKETVDQLHSYRAADLRLCFRICEKQLFYYTAQIKAIRVHREKRSRTRNSPKII